MKPIGTKVTIRKDLYPTIDYFMDNKIESDAFISEMAIWGGRKATIIGCMNKKYQLNIDNGKWNWTDEMFEKENDKMIKYVSVEFLSGYSSKNYSFKTDLDLTDGDIVVCDTINGYSIGRIVEVRDTLGKATKWIVQKVDVDSFNRKLEKEKKLEEIKKNMEKRAKELTDMEFFVKLAGSDDEMKQLLDEYNQINK